MMRIRVDGWKHVRIASMLAMNRDARVMRT